jgi:hypothetical protein
MEELAIEDKQITGEGAEVERSMGRVYACVGYSGRGWRSC